MRRLFNFLVFCLLFVVASISKADIVNEKPEIANAIMRYYHTVDKAKSTYAAELRKALASTQKTGNLDAYNAIDAELKHTMSKDGHKVTGLNFPERSNLYFKKAALKKSVDAARSDFKKHIKSMAADLLKEGFPDQARQVAAFADADEPPRLDAQIKQLAERNNIVRQKLLNIPDAKLKWEPSSFRGSWSEMGCFTPDGKRFVAVSHGEGGANVFDLETGKTIVKLRCGKSLLRTHISPDNKTAASGTSDGKILFWNVDNGSVIREIQGHAIGSQVCGICFTPDGSLLVSAAHDKNAILWDVKTGKEIRRFSGHSDAVLAAKISPDGTMLATSSSDKSIILWDLSNGKQLHCMADQPGNVDGLAFNHQGTLLASGSGDTVCLWDVRTGKLARRWPGIQGGVLSVDFSPNDTELLIGCINSLHTAVWDVATGLPLYRLPDLGGWNRDAAFSSDGKLIATCSTRHVSIWNAPTRNELRQWEENETKKRETAKELPLKDLPIEQAQVAWDSWHIGTYRLENVEHENSLYAHAPSRYAFRLDRKWKTLVTWFGILEEHNGSKTDFTQASCVFIVKADGKEIFRSMSAGPGTGNKLLNVNNVDLLELIVEPNGSNAFDRAIWATPTVSR